MLGLAAGADPHGARGVGRPPRRARPHAHTAPLAAPPGGQHRQVDERRHAGEVDYPPGGTAHPPLRPPLLGQAGEAPDTGDAQFRRPAARLCRPSLRCLCRGERPGVAAFVHRRPDGLLPRFPPRGCPRAPGGLRRVVRDGRVGIFRAAGVGVPSPARPLRCRVGARAGRGDPLRGASWR